MLLVRGILRMIVPENFVFLSFIIVKICTKMCFPLNSLKMKMVAIETNMGKNAKRDKLLFLTP